MTDFKRLALDYALSHVDSHRPSYLAGVKAALEVAAQCSNRAITASEMAAVIRALIPQEK